MEVFGLILFICGMIAFVVFALTLAFSHSFVVGCLIVSLLLMVLGWAIHHIFQ